MAPRAMAEASDGATFAYMLAFDAPHRFAGVAAAAGRLPPDLPLDAAKNLPVLIVQGARDFMFPVQAAQDAHARL